jgi:hypothetical protein
VNLVIELLDAFLEWAQVNGASKSYDSYQRQIQMFNGSIPRTPLLP